jgi:hypothetical protein
VVAHAYWLTIPIADMNEKLLLRRNGTPAFCQVKWLFELELELERNTDFDLELDL